MKRREYKRGCLFLSLSLHFYIVMCMELKFSKEGKKKKEIKSNIGFLGLGEIEIEREKGGCFCHGSCLSMHLDGLLI